MELLLQREKSNSACTPGELFVNGLFECYTMEDVVRPDGEKIYGNTAIPAGRYLVTITFSNRFQKDLPLVHNVPNFEGIRIHAGNTAADTNGCPLVGRKRSEDGLGIAESRIAMSELQPKIQAALDSGEEVWLTVQNADG